MRLVSRVAGEFRVGRSGNPDQQFLMKREPRLGPVSALDYAPEVTLCRGIRQLVVRHLRAVSGESDERADPAAAE